MRNAAAAAALAAVLACFAVPASAIEPAEAQAVFAAAMKDAAAGRLRSAAEGLERLSREDPTPRVKLELARVRLAMGEASEALRLFREVHGDPSTPVQVKANILPHMEAAELRVFRLRHGVRLATDSNPSRVSDGGTIYFNGVPFEYEPPKAKKTEFGAEPWVSAEKMWQGGVIGRAQASARVFRDEDLNSASLHLSLGAPVPGVRRAMVTAAVDTRLADSGSWTMPSVDAWKRFAVPEGYDAGVGAQVGYFFHENPDISGGYYRPYVFARAPLGPVTAFARASVERMDSANAYYSHVTPKIEAGFEAEAAGFSLVPKIELSSAFYDQFDPFFGVTRQDTTVRPSLSFSHEAVAWNGYVPEVSVSYENRNSNVFVNSYEQWGGSINLKKAF